MDSLESSSIISQCKHTDTRFHCVVIVTTSLPVFSQSLSTVVLLPHRRFIIILSKMELQSVCTYVLGSICTTHTNTAGIWDLFFPAAASIGWGRLAGNTKLSQNRYWWLSREYSLSTFFLRERDFEKRLRKRSLPGLNEYMYSQGCSNNLDVRDKNVAVQPHTQALPIRPKLSLFSCFLSVFSGWHSRLN